MLLRIVYHLNSFAKSLIVDMDEADIKDRANSEGTSQVEEEVRGVERRYPEGGGYTDQNSARSSA